jgi:hypothetical protein
LAEVSSKTVIGIIPVGTGSGTASLFRTVVFIQGTSAANNDTLTVTGLTTVNGAFLISTTGTVIAMTFATNIITMTNSGTLVVSGLAWGT